MSKFPVIKTEKGDLKVQKIQITVTANGKDKTYVFMTPEKVENILSDPQGLGDFLSSLCRGVLDG